MGLPPIGKNSQETCGTAYWRMGTPLEALTWKKGPLKLSKDCAEKWEYKIAFVLPPWETRISCLVEPSEAALATHNALYKRT